MVRVVSGRAAVVKAERGGIKSHSYTKTAKRSMHVNGTKSIKNDFVFIILYKKLILHNSAVNIAYSCKMQLL